MFFFRLSELCLLFVNVERREEMQLYMNENTKNNMLRLYYCQSKRAEDRQRAKREKMELNITNEPHCFVNINICFVIFLSIGVCMNVDCKRVGKDFSTSMKYTLERSTKRSMTFYQ